MKNAIAQFRIAVFLGKLCLAMGTAFGFYLGSPAPFILGGIGFYVFKWSRPAYDENMKG